MQMMHRHAADGRCVSSGVWLLFHPMLFPAVCYLCSEEFGLSVSEPLIWVAVFLLISPFFLSFLL